MGDGGRAFRGGDFHHALGDERARDGCAEEVLAFIDGAGAHHGENEIAREFFLQVVYVDFTGAGGEGFFLEALEFFALADIGGESDDFGLIVFLEPLQDDGCVESTGVCQYNFHSLIPFAPGWRFMGGDDRALRMKIKPKRRGGRIGGSILESARAHFF